MNSLKVSRARRGFTLIELVVVVLVMGILAAVAAPKMFDTASNAKANATRQSLVVIRDAIELYKAQEGTYPGQAGSGTALADNLKPYIKGPFPKAAIAGVPGNGSVKYDAATTAEATPTTDLIYNKADGTFFINHADHDDL
jgi:general secretion pathway protein G